MSWRLLLQQLFQGIGSAPNRPSRAQAHHARDNGHSKPASWPTMWPAYLHSGRRTCAASVLCCALLSLLLFARPWLLAHSRRRAATGFEFAMRDLHGEHTRLSDSGLEAVWTRPRNGATPLGVLVLLHGCGHSGTDFFPRSPSCAACIGLPEEVRVVAAALSRSLVPVALTSTDRRSGCWRRTDAPLIVDAVRQLTKQQSLVATDGAELPLFVFGASSGGSLALHLPHSVKLAGVIAEIASVPAARSADNDALAAQRCVGGIYPSTAFVYMPRDERLARAVRANVLRLREQRTPVTEFQVMAQRITDDFFTKRMFGVDRDTSALIREALYDAGAIDASSELIKDPRRVQWRDALQRALPQLAEADNHFKADQSAMSELLNVAYASHELTSLYVPYALDFVMASALSHAPSADPR